MLSSSLLSLHPSGWVQRQWKGPCALSAALSSSQEHVPYLTPMSHSLGHEPPGSNAAGLLTAAPSATAAQLTGDNMRWLNTTTCSFYL